MPRSKPTSAANTINAARTAAEQADRARLERAVASAKADRKELLHRVVELEQIAAFVHSAPCRPPVISTPRSRPKSGLRSATPCFVVSDLHFGERVTLQESLGANRYDMKVATQRMAKCWDNMLWLRDDMKRTQACDDTFLALLGDNVSGDIHEELSETNDGGMRDQTNACTDALLPGIAALADATPGTLHVVCIGGNHGRLTKKTQIKNGSQHSAEVFGIYDPLRRVLGDRGGKIAWHIPDAERHIMVIHGRRVSSQHGTMIRSAGGIGGVLVPMTRWVTRAADADLYLFGHFHEADAYGKVIKNGSLIGESGYTRWLGVESRPPEQVAFVLDADRGVRRFERVSVT